MMKFFAALLVSTLFTLMLACFAIGIYKLADDIPDNEGSGWVWSGISLLVFLILIIGGAGSTGKEESPEKFSVTIDVQNIDVHPPGFFDGEWRKVKIFGKDREVFEVMAEEGIAGFIVSGKKYTLYYKKEDDLFYLLYLEEKTPAQV